MTRVPLAAGLSLLVVHLGPATWALMVQGGGWHQPLGDHPTREAAVLAAEDVASVCAAALAMAAGCARRMA